MVNRLNFNMLDMNNIDRIIENFPVGEHNVRATYFVPNQAQSQPSSITDYTHIQVFAVNITTVNVTLDSPITKALHGADRLVYITADPGYKVPLVAPTVTGAQSYYTRLNEEHAILRISCPIDTVSCTITGEQSTIIDNFEYIDPYLYEVQYRYIDYDFANSYFNKNKVALWGACSSCRNGQYFGRNFDWYYNHDAEFVIRTLPIDGRKATIGVTFKYGFTDTQAEEEAPSDYVSDNYKILPFFTLDGLNEDGVYCNTNIVPVADNPAPTTKTGSEGQPEYSMNMICRYVIDNFSSALEAVNALKNNIRIVSCPELSAGGYEAHWMIGDANHTYVVEILNNIVVSTEINIMTNFYTYGVTRNSDGSLYSVKDNTSGSCPAITVNGLRPYSDGVERFNILNNGLSSVNNEDDMLQLMKQVWYTQMYDTSKFNDHSFWYTELLEKGEGARDRQISVLPSELEQLKPIIDDIFEKRSRHEGSTWQTVHTSIYDASIGRLYILPQEGTYRQYYKQYDIYVK